MIDFDLVQVVGCHQVIERHFKHFGHFTGLRHRYEIRINHGHHRRDPVAGNRHEGIEIAQRLHLAGRQCDFLLALAQCSGQRIAVIGFGAATGETDLATMGTQGFGAPCKNHLRTVGARHDARQHGGFHRGPGRQQIDQFATVPTVAGRRLGQWMQRAHQAFVVGQRTAQ